MGSSSRVPAAARTLRVLRHLASQPRPVPAAAIARALELPRSSTYHLLAELERERFVTYLPEERRYALGVAAFEIGSAYLRHEGIERLAWPLVARLARETSVTAHLGILDGREVLYLAKVQPDHPDPLVTEVGVRLPAHLTASGRCLLARLPPAQLTATFPTTSTLTDRTGRGPRTIRALRQRLATEREQGWAEEDGEVTPGFASIAAAAIDHGGRPAASVGITFRSEGRDEEARRELVRAVLATSGALGRRLGGGAGGGSLPGS